VAAVLYRSVVKLGTTDTCTTEVPTTLYITVGPVDGSGRWPCPQVIEELCRVAEKVERFRERDGFNGPSRRSKQKPPLHKRAAKRRRRTALAKHHRKVMKLAAKAKAIGKRASYPKRPSKPRG